MKILKKIIIYLSIVIAFILSIIFGGKYINILAYSNINTVGSFPLQLDIDNYNRENLFNSNLLNGKGGIVVSNNGQTITMPIIYGGNGAIDTGLKLKELCPDLKVGDIYSLNFIRNFNDGNNYIYLSITQYLWFNNSYKTITQNDLDSNVYFYGNRYSSGYTEQIVITNFMINEGRSGLNYSSFFEFGYNVGYGFELYNNTNTSQTTAIQLRDENNNILLTNNVTVAANSNTYYASNNYVYIPFNISDNGSFTFNRTFNIYFTNTNILPNTSMSNNNVNGIFFILTYNAYYKGEYTTKIHFRNNYLLNNIAMVGVKLSLINNITNNASDLAAGITISKTKYDDFFTCPGTNNSGEITESPICNVATNKVIETNYYNSIDISYFANDNDDIETYAFIVEGSFNNINLFINTYFNINITSFNARVVGNNEISPPTNDNPLFSNKYNKCEAWYDIPCQLGNAITYVIYEAPIISPIVNFVMSFINVIDYVIIYIKWFEELGVIFSLFIFILLIRLLIMTVKGSNDDRGKNNE